MDISLASHKWELKGYWPWVPVKGTSMEVGNELLGVTDWIPATVPGGVHQDLYRAGFIEDPYRDLNSLNCEWVENRWWVYRTRFEKPEISGSRVELVFKGLDYESAIYMNGTLLGEHKGMYHPAVFDVTDMMVAADVVELTIVFKQAPDEMAQIGKTSETFTQKSRFNYKWDFSTRLVNVGIWDDVLIRTRQQYSVDDIALHTDVANSAGIITLSGNIQCIGDHTDNGKSPRVMVKVIDPDGREVANWENAASPEERFEAVLSIEKPALWFPNGYGEQPLYEVRISLASENGDSVFDRRVYRTGIRKLCYIQNEGGPDDALPYTFVINDRKIYIMGANLTPLDHLYGNVTRERYDWMVHLAVKANINMLRIWGGGIIEKTYLYELCDRYGILIWQEFIQSSSGIDNVPSKRPEFLELLQETAAHALRERRNHVALTVWSGGNELMSAPDKPSTYEDSNLSLLKSMVERYDPQRLFLPTSASGPVQYITERKGVSHDVHGHWKYQGNPDHYKLYGDSDCLFHSEFGVDGLSALKSLTKFLSPKHLRPDSMNTNLVWRHHGEWWDTHERDTNMFGEQAELSSFVDCSQWIQAEGLRYILEANRRRKFTNSGSIIWQMNEPWPNVSCTNLVDYYNETKMAYYWVKNAFQADHATLDYRKLDYRIGEPFNAPIYVHRNDAPMEVTVCAELVDGSGKSHGSWDFTILTEQDKAVEAGVLSFTVPTAYNDLFFVRLSVRTLEGTYMNTSNLYVFSTGQGPVYGAALQMKDSKLEVSYEDDWTTVQANIGNGSMVREKVFEVRNTGTVAALHVYPQEETDRYWMVADDAYRTLFPGETMKVRVTCFPKPDGLFEDEQVNNESAEIEPVISFFSFGQLEEVVRE